ncbi:MAG: acyltransferase [Hymenobacter sp.]|nr:MAG: acyltransferase [Hymenobacter sp.]
MEQSPVLPPTSSPGRRKFEFNLEALRGFAAITVVFHHIIYHKFSLDPAYALTGKWLYSFPGHSCVLLFFILSGYVIGLTTTKPLVGSSIKEYGRKRLLRLYPIYFVSLLLALLILTHQYAAKTIIGQFFFLQNSVVPLLYENNPLWSLNNEVLYYLLFIPVSYWRLSPGRVFLATIALGVVLATVASQYVLGSYFIGFAFWISGLWLAQSTTLTKAYCSKLELAALLFMFLGYDYLNPLVTTMFVSVEKLHIPLAQRVGQAGLFAGVTLTDFCSLPFLFYIFLRFTNHTFKGSSSFCVFICLSSFWYYYHIVTKYGAASPEGASLALPLVLFSIGTLLLLINYIRPVTQQAVTLPASFLKLGAISYGIYVVHFPTSLILSRITFFSGSLFSFSVRVILDVSLVIGIGYLLEKKFQPKIKSLFS